MSNPDELLCIEGIRKTFPGVVALDGVDFDLRRGEVHVLLGENGAGKSTLIKMLSGAYRPDAGRILVGGEEVRIHGAQDSERLGSALWRRDAAAPVCRGGAVGDQRCPGAVSVSMRPMRLSMASRYLASEAVPAPCWTDSDCGSGAGCGRPCSRWSPPGRRLGRCHRGRRSPFWKRVYALGARFMAVPGWPLPTFCTASAARMRAVSTARWSNSVHSKSDTDSRVLTSGQSSLLGVVSRGGSVQVRPVTPESRGGPARLPLWPWMASVVTVLESHPNDPGRTAVTA